jgi:hypothetical protein
MAAAHPDLRSMPAHNGTTGKSVAAWTAPRANRLKKAVFAPD